MPNQMPAVSLAAAPGKRRWTVDLAREIERAGFAGIYCASFGDGMGLCLSIAHATNRIRFGTSIANIYARNAIEMAGSASYIHEISGGRFTLGLGVSHGRTHERMGIHVGKPLSDMRAYVSDLRAASAQSGELPPIILGTLRRKMVALAAELADGAVWANGSRSHMTSSLSKVPAERRGGDFFVGNMVPTCIDDDREAAKAVARRALRGYLALPNYRNYWKEAGYAEGIAAVEGAIANGEQDSLPELMGDDWLADVALFGSRPEVMDGIDAWYAAGVTTPILVPYSTSGGQKKAFEELFAAFK